MRWVATFFLFFRGFILLLPFFIHIKLSVSEIASCTFYYHAIRSCARVFYGQRLYCLWRLSAKKAIDRILKFTNSHVFSSLTCDLWPVTSTLAPPVEITTFPPIAQLLQPYINTQPTVPLFVLSKAYCSKRDLRSLFTVEIWLLSFKWCVV